MNGIISQKRSGTNAASEEEIAEFDSQCKELGVETINVQVTDEEHELLSLTAHVPFVFSKFSMNILFFLKIK